MVFMQANYTTEKEFGAPLQFQTLFFHSPDSCNITTLPARGAWTIFVLVVSPDVPVDAASCEEKYHARAPGSPFISRRKIFKKSLTCRMLFAIIVPLVF